MSAREDAYARHQQVRWMRPDAHLWIREDAVRFARPKVGQAGASLARDRKYDPNQPRVPAGSTGGGQWTSGGGGGAGASPMGNIDLGDLPSFGDLFALFQIAPSTFDNTDFTQLVGDVPDGERPGIGHNEGPSLEPPEIPAARPATSAERMAVVWGAVEWIGKVRRYSPAAGAYFGILNEAEWFKSYEPIIKSYYDPPETLEQLQQNAQKPNEAGYHNHHIEEQSLLEKLGFSRAERNRPDNLARVPVLKHYDVSGWYGTKNPDFGGLSPREYLADKDAATRRVVGLYALRLFGVLKP